MRTFLFHDLMLVMFDSLQFVQYLFDSFVSLRLLVFSETLFDLFADAFQLVFVLLVHGFSSSDQLFDFVNLLPLIASLHLLLPLLAAVVRRVVWATCPSSFHVVLLPLLASMPRRSRHGGSCWTVVTAAFCVVVWTRDLAVTVAFHSIVVCPPRGPMNRHVNWLKWSRSSRRLLLIPAALTRVAHLHVILLWNPAVVAL